MRNFQGNIFIWTRKYREIFKFALVYFKLCLCVRFFDLVYCSSLYSIVYFVGNTAKGRISKRVFQENKARQIFQKTNISYPLIRTRTSAYQGVKMFVFSENLTCFAFLKLRFWNSPFCLITVCLKLKLLWGWLWVGDHVSCLLSF